MLSNRLRSIFRHSSEHLKKNSLCHTQFADGFLATGEGAVKLHSFCVRDKILQYLNISIILPNPVRRKEECLQYMRVYLSRIEAVSID